MYFYTVNKSELKMAVQTGQTCMPGEADIFYIIRCRLEILQNSHFSTKSKNKQGSLQFMLS